MQKLSAIPAKECKIIRLKVDEINSAIIDIVSKEEYVANAKNMPQNIYNDRKILEIASFAKLFYSSELIFLSLDIMARTRAISLDIKTDSLVGSSKDDFDFEFNKEVTVNFEEIEFLDNSNIIKFDPKYKPYNFTYCFKVKSSDQMILAMVQNGKICVLDEEKIRDQVITPLNKEQLFFSNAILEHYYNVLIVEAKAGSGKTLLALSGALKLIKRKEFQRIIYIRNSIESLDKGEDVGYLPGLEEKFKIYNHPLMDSLDYIIKINIKKKCSQKECV